MFLKEAWYVAAWASELQARPVGRMITGEPVVLYRTAAGRVAALEDRCCHRHYPLSKGRIDGEILQCGYHGFRFDTTGCCVAVPSQRAVPESARVRSYPVVERHALVWIWMGDPRSADPARIADFSWLDSPAWKWKGTCYPVKAGYELIVENLLDLTHITFVHPSTIGNYALIDQADVRTTRAEDHVTVTRWMENSDPPPTYQRAGHFRGKVDRWQMIRFTKPALVRLSVGAMDAGLGARTLMGDGFAAPRSARQTRGHGIGMFNFNMITPETERSTHYFWAQGHDFHLEDPGVTELVFSQVEIAFHEDWAVFEEIQRNMDSRPGAPRVDVNGDNGGIQAIRMLRAAIDAEQAAARDRSA